MRIFEEIGAEIERAWSSENHELDAFPALVTRILAERRSAFAGLRTLDVLEWALDSLEDLPKQHDVQAIFAEPPISVFDSPHFHIQVLCWRRGTTAIHEHGFVGGFLVLEGLNLHTSYRFEPRTQISARLQVGDVRLDKAELLGPGAVVPITPELKHNVFHLQAPAATLVVRSQPDRTTPKLDYFYPSLAFDPFDVDPLVLRRTQILRLLIHTEHTRHDELAAALLERCDLPTTWDVLEQSCSEIPDPARVAELVEIARRRHGRIIDELLAVIDEQTRMRHALRLHVAERDPGRQFFLALLHSVPDREVIFALIRERYPGVDPRTQICEWVEQLSGVERIGVDMQDPVNRLVFDALLDGCTPADLLDRLAQRFDPQSVAEQAEQVLAHCRRFQTTLLAPLVRGASGL